MHHMNIRVIFHDRLSRLVVPAAGKGAAVVMMHPLVGACAQVAGVPLMIYRTWRYLGADNVLFGISISLFLYQRSDIRPFGAAKMRL